MSNRSEIDLAVEKESVRQQAVSYRWMTKHLGDFSPNQASAQILTDFVKQNGLDWSEESLDLAFEACRYQLSPPSSKQSEPELESRQWVNQAEPVDDLPAVPEGVPAVKTKAEIRDLDSRVYREHFHNKKTGPAFRARVDEVLRRGK